MIPESPEASGENKIQYIFFLKAILPRQGGEV